MRSVANWMAASFLGLPVQYMTGRPGPRATRAGGSNKSPLVRPGGAKPPEGGVGAKSLPCVGARDPDGSRSAAAPTAEEDAGGLARAAREAKLTHARACGASISSGWGIPIEGAGHAVERSAERAPEAPHTHAMVERRKRKSVSDRQRSHSVPMQATGTNGTDGIEDVLESGEMSMDRESMHSVVDRISMGLTVEQIQAQMARLEAEAHRRRSSAGRVSLIDKIFGRDDQNLEGVEEHDKRSVFVEAMDPRRTGRLRWDVVIVAAVMYNCLIMPMRIGFGDDKFGPMSLIDLMIDFTFICDIFVNFTTGYFKIDKDTGAQVLVTVQPEPAMHYLRTWFFFDLIASLPVDLMLLMSVSPNVLLYMRFPRMLRILRLPRLFRYLKRWEEYIGISPQVLRLCKTLFLLFLFAHFSACIQFFASQLQDFPADSWVSKAGIQDSPKIEQYAFSLFTSLSHMLCIGYGPTGGPRNITEVWLITVSMVIGASFYIILVGMITTTLVNTDSKRRDHARMSVYASSVAAGSGQNTYRRDSRLSNLSSASGHRKRDSFESEV